MFAAAPKLVQTNRHTRAVFDGLLNNSLVNVRLAGHALHALGQGDRHDFPALNLARQAGLTGGTMPAMFNAANEVAVQAFIDGRISFPGIWQTVEKALSNLSPRPYHGQLSIILEDDAAAREEAASIIAR